MEQKFDAKQLFLVAAIAPFILVVLSCLSIYLIFPAVIKPKSSVIPSQIFKPTDALQAAPTTVVPENSDVVRKVYPEDKLSREFWRKFLGWTEAEENDSLDYFEDGIDLFKYDETHYLVQVTFDTSAYQRGFRLFWVDLSGKNPTSKRLVLQQKFTGSDKKLTTDNSGYYWGSLLTDFPSKTFSVLQKCNGLGGCGTLNIYKIEGNNIFLLKTAENDGDPMLPEQWPVVWER